MNRAALFRAAELARSAMDAATIAASCDRVRPERAAEFARLADEALTAARDALAEASSPVTVSLAARPTEWFAVAAEITQPMERAA